MGLGLIQKRWDDLLFNNRKKRNWVDGVGCGRG